MRTVTVELFNENALALLQDLERLDILRVIPNDETIGKTEVLSSIRNGLKDVSLHRKGKKQLKTLQELINDL